jgi:auxin-responsive protein IAA
MGDSNGRETLPRLLDLIPDGKEWKVWEAQGEGRSRNTGFVSEEDRKLELKLGLPGLLEEEAATVSRHEGIQQERSALSLCCFREPSKPTKNITTTGTKRVFLDTIEVKTEGKQLSSILVLCSCLLEMTNTETNNITTIILS